ncbi:MAG: asparagine synthase-related protein [Pseudonocardiaceae bacterium]
MTLVHLREADPVRLGPSGLPIISAWDVAIGCPAGSVPLPPQPTRIRPDPACALRDALRPALLCTPCVVAFSGGRDSSLLLAVAADLAAREGMRPPTALTFRYPGDPAADESSWQELVVAHLRNTGLRFRWVRRDITSELDNIGPLMAPVLRAHGGPTFPAGLGNTILLAQHASGGSLVTGNAGDEVLGGHRASVLRTVLRRRGHGLSTADWRHAMACAAPRPVRLRLGRREVDDAPWLRPVLRGAAVAETMRREAARPLWWDRSVWAALAPRAVMIGNRARARIAQDCDCELVEPLGSPDFVASYAAFGGRWGGITRAAGTRMLAAGLLPDAIIDRRHKTHFNASRFGPVSREFAQAWDGRGVDDSLVDPVALRAAWLVDVPPASTAMLLQQAWLASQTEAP